MTKKTFRFLLLTGLAFVVLFSCRKGSYPSGDPTKNYFPVVFGKYVTYDVDSIYYVTTFDTSAEGKMDTICGEYEVKSQMKYCITDTARDVDDSLMYMVSVFRRYYDGGLWQQEGGVLYIKQKPDSIVLSQDGNKYVKMMFPIQNGKTWFGNDQVQVNIAQNAYFNNWTYTYQNIGKSFNNNLHIFDNTVTVLEDDESVNYPYVNAKLSGYRTYAKEVYAYNIGLVYKEWTHFTYTPPFTCANGYTVVMRAIDHN